MKSLKFALSILVLAILAGCQNVEFKKSSGGVPYKIFSGTKKGDSVRAGTIVKYQVIQKIKDSVIYSS